MKLFNQYKKHLLICSVLLIISGGIEGQIHSYASLNLHKKTNLWQQELNPAGAWLDNPLKYATANFDFNYMNGSFHKSQEGESVRDIKFNTEGVVMLGKNYIYGEFNYTNRSVKEAGFNASLIDPYRGMPYGIADLNHSDWKNQYYDMGMRWASAELIDKLSVGLDFYYSAHSGAKQRDIRADSRLMRLELRPGVLWSINTQHHIGAFFNYYSLKEESSNSNVNSYVDQEYYELNGLGNSIHGVGRGRSTNYSGDSFGGGLEYSWMQQNYKLLLASNYHLKAEKAEDSFTQPRDVGSVRHGIWDTNFKLLTQSSSDYSHLIHLNYTNSLIKGVEYVTQRDNSEAQLGWVSHYSGVRSKYKKQNITAHYSITALDSEDYVWMAEAAISYSSHKDKYLLPYSEGKANNVLSEILLQRNIKMRGVKNPRLLLSGGVVYNKNVSGGFEYGGKNPESIPVVHMATRDYDYLQTNYWGLNTALNYSQKLKVNLDLSWYIEGYFSYMKTSKFDFNHRKKIGVSLGCVF